MSRFYLTPDAKNSLKSIATYTEKTWGKEQQIRYLKALYASFQDLADLPMKGRPRAELHPDLRSFPQGSHMIFYLPGKKNIVVVNVLHKRMDHERHLSVFDRLD